MIDRDDWSPSGEHLPELITATVVGDHFWLTMEMQNGDVIHVGDHAGMRGDYLASLIRDFGEDCYEYLADCVYEAGYEG